VIYSKFKKEIEDLNYDHFMWMKAYNQLPIGKAAPEPEVFFQDDDGVLHPIEISFAPSHGIVIKKK